MPPHFHLHQFKTSITELKTSITEYKASWDQYNVSFLELIQILQAEIHTLRTITVQETQPQQHPTTTPCHPSSPISPLTTPTLPNLPSPAQPKLHFRSLPLLRTSRQHFLVTSADGDVLLIRDEVQISKAIGCVTENGVSKPLVELPPPAIPPSEPPDRLTILPYDRASVPPPPEPPDSDPHATAYNPSSTTLPWWNRATGRQLATNTDRDHCGKTLHGKSSVGWNSLLDDRLFGFDPGGNRAVAYHHAVLSSLSCCYVAISVPFSPFHTFPCSTAEPAMAASTGLAKLLPTESPESQDPWKPLVPWSLKTQDTHQGASSPFRSGASPPPSHLSGTSPAMEQPPGAAACWPWVPCCRWLLCMRGKESQAGAKLEGNQESPLINLMGQAHLFEEWMWINKGKVWPSLVSQSLLNNGPINQNLQIQFTLLIRVLENKMATQVEFMEAQEAWAQMPNWFLFPTMFQLAESISMSISIGIGQPWDPGGYLEMPSAARSSQFKQWDPGKFILGSNFYNLEDKVDLMGWVMLG